MHIFQDEFHKILKYLLNCYQIDVESKARTFCGEQACNPARVSNGASEEIGRSSKTYLQSAPG